MGRYIKLDKSQPRDPRLMDLAKDLYGRLGLRLCRRREDGSLEELPEEVTRHALRHAGLGVTVTLWCYADEWIERDDTLPVTLEGLAQVVNVPVDILAMMPARWIKLRSDGRVELPRYVEKNNIVARDLRTPIDAKREGARLRKQRQRDRERAGDKSRRSPKRRVTGVTRDMSRSHGPTGTHNPIPEGAGSLASALGRLARRPGNGNGAAEAGAESRTKLRADARTLAKNGMPHDDVVRLVAHQGISADEVRHWLAEPETNQERPT